jgi:hypothetical protein
MFLLTSSIQSKIQPKIQPKIQSKIQPKICVNCKFFMPPQQYSANEYGKCALFPYRSSKFLVDGVIRDHEYNYCSTAREHDDLCGKEGKKYKKARKVKSI